MDDFPVFIIASKLSWTPWITSVSSQSALLGSHPLRRATLGSLSLSSSSAILASMNPHTSISFFSYFCGSCSQRWLAFVDGAAGRMYLQNPVTGELIWLPETSDASWNAQSLRRPKFIQMYFWNLKIHLPLKVAISSVPTDPDCVVAVMWNIHSRVNFLSIKELVWNSIPYPPYQLAPHDQFHDILFHKNHFYISIASFIFMLDLEANDDKGEMVLVQLRDGDQVGELIAYCHQLLG